MTKRITLKNRIVLCVLMVAMMLCASIGLTDIFTIRTTLASSSASITNGNFSSNVESSYPFAPNGWTASDDIGSLSVKAGVISTDTTAYNNNQTDLELDGINNPDKVGTDDYILMLNAKGSSFGYTSSDITIAQGEHYRITVNVWSRDYIASMYLSSSADSAINSAKIENVHTNGTWSTYYFYVSGYNYKDITINLGLFVGQNPSVSANGVVFYDDISIDNISDQDLRTQVASLSGDSDKYCYVDLSSENVLDTYDFADQPFTVDEHSNALSNNAEYTTYTYANMTASNIIFPNGATRASAGTDLTYGNSTSLAVLNAKESAVCFSSPAYTLLPNRVYKFNIRVKVASISSGSAFVAVREGDDADFLTTVTLSSVTSNKMTNGYKDVCIYVRSADQDTTTVTLHIGLGDNSTLAKGEVYFTNYSISLVPYTTYSNASTSSYVGKASLTSSNDFSSVSNPLFNNTTYDGTDTAVYPSQPENWTGTNTTLASGVVNTQYFDSYISKVSSFVTATAQNPGAIAGYKDDLVNNVLVIYNNVTTGKQSYTSSTLSVSAGTYTKISVSVQTQLVNATGGASISLLSNGIVLAQFDDIRTDGMWTDYTFYIYSAQYALDLSVELALGNGANAPAGYAFFDNVLKDRPVAITTLDGITADDHNAVVDLSDTLITGTKKGNYYTSSLYTGSTQSGSNDVNYGIIDTAEDMSFVPSDIDLPSSTKLLTIFSTLDTHTTLTSKLSYDLSENGYYKLSFKVLTYSLAQYDPDNVKKDDNNKVIPYGVKLGLSNFEDELTAIDTHGVWKEYALYINPTSATSSAFVLSLGDTDALTAGSVYMTAPVLTTFDAQSAYDEDMSAFRSAHTADNVLEITSPVVEEDEDDTTTDDSDSADINWYIIPSLITALAVIIALVGTFVRKFKFKKRSKVKTSSYDRDLTVLRQMYRRQALAERDRLVKELESEKADLLAEKDTHDTEYKANLASVRTLKNKRDPKLKGDIAKLERTMHSQTKHMSHIGVRINEIDYELKRINSETYLTQLEIQISKQRDITPDAEDKE